MDLTRGKMTMGKSLDKLRAEIKVLERRQEETQQRRKLEAKLRALKNQPSVRERMRRASQSRPARVARRAGFNFIRNLERVEI